MPNRKIAAILLLFLLLAASACRHKRRAARIAEEYEVTSVQELYQKGQGYLEKERPITARKYFDQITLREDAGEYRELAEIAMAETFYQEHTLDSFAEAISRFKAFVTFNPTHEKAPHCWMRIADAYLEEMSTPDRDTSTAKSARSTLKSLIENYPESAESKVAAAKLVEVENFLAAHEIKVGDYYMKGNHYAGAIERYLTVTREYPSYWNMPLVHSRLGRANHGYGRDGKAVEYYRRVIEEAPGTRLSEEARRAVERIGESASAGKEQGDSVLEEDPVKNKRWWQFWKKSNKEKLPDDDMVQEKEKHWWQFWK